MQMGQKDLLQVVRVWVCGKNPSVITVLYNYAARTIHQVACTFNMIRTTHRYGNWLTLVSQKLKIWIHVVYVRDFPLTGCAFEKEWTKYTSAICVLKGMRHVRKLCTWSSTTFVGTYLEFIPKIYKFGNSKKNN